MFAVTLGLVAAVAAPAQARPAATEVPLGVIPLPAAVEREVGRFDFVGLPVVRVGDPRDDELGRVARRGGRFLEEALGRPVIVEDAGHEEPSRGEGVVVLILDPSFPDSSSEAYALTTGPDGVRLAARGHAGIFYGLQTLRQLVRPEAPDGWSAPRVRVIDRPRFPYRGMHLDVARHFFPVEVVKRYIDLLARYKLNTFHWHLTDDQGWRIEIERYPGLTEIGAFRRETMVGQNFDPYVGDGVPYGGFYTRDEIREVVAYAAERYVTVVPEIEMPGHALAALAAYPELACTPGPFEVATSWGVFEDVFCPTERTFAFLEGVLTEVMELFPGPWIHVGGDEVPKTRWRDSEDARAVIRREGLADEDELHGWFIARIERFLNDHGRRLIGWDEILEAGPPPRATVMSWRGMGGGIEAARSGHDVIMTPTDHAYFDYYQGDPAAEPLAIGGYTPLERVYAFEPVPDELTADEARRILGPQANLWTEYVRSPAHLEYMLMPRLLALAEVAWSPRDARDQRGFEARLAGALETLDRIGIQYRIPDVRGLAGDRLVLEPVVEITLTHPHPGAAIHFTRDGSEPGPTSPRYTGPVSLVPDEPVEIRARAILPDGRMGPVGTGRLRRTALRPGGEVDESVLDPGLRYEYFERSVASVRELGDDAEPRLTAVVPGVSLRGGERDERFALRFSGHLGVPEDGVYRFTLLSDDGAVLRIGEEVVVDHDGLHGPSERAGEVALAAGYHPFTVRYFQAGGGRALQLWVRSPGGEERRPIPEDWFRHEP